MKGFEKVKAVKESMGIDICVVFTQSVHAQILSDRRWSFYNDSMVW